MLPPGSHHGLCQATLIFPIPDPLHHRRLASDSAFHYLSLYFSVYFLEKLYLLHEKILEGRVSVTFLGISHVT